MSKGFHYNNRSWQYSGHSNHRVTNKCRVSCNINSQSHPLFPVADAYFKHFETLVGEFSSGCTKTYVRLSGTGRSSVRTCKPLTWLVHGTSTFFIRRKKYRNSWKLTSNYSRIEIYLIVTKAHLIFDKIRLNVPFNFAILRPSHLFLQAPFESKPIYN